MNNSNSFNICPRCGTANSLNAKYCYQCGSQLKVPEEPVVCRNCHSVNTSMANFCRTCGASLKTGVQTKICPRCRMEVKIDQNQCGCGYSFATVRSAKPTPTAVNPRTGKAYSDSSPSPVEEEIDEQPVSSGKAAGRVFASIAVVLILILAYIVYSPSGAFETNFPTMTNWQLDFMGGLNGFALASANPDDFTYVGFTDYFVSTLFTSLDNLANGTAVPFTTWIVLAVIAIPAICMIAHLIVAIVRIFTGKRSKKGNLAYMILGIIYGLIAIFTTLAMLNVAQFINDWYTALFDIYLPRLGWVIMAAYFLFFWLYSLVAKHKREVAFDEDEDEDE